ncbi:hypothetical protein [Micromonospora sp. DT31]|uniref:hypothetical protein n=1 Tax=Micromonospora sp. DT31 TaxID=3393434 RepID=UPI003CFB4FFB
MASTTDRAVVLATLAQAADIVFLEPSEQRVTQDEVHHDARELIRRRGLPAGTPYAGWHTQASAFGPDGSLQRPQRVCFGGDREVVGRALRRLAPLGYAVFGGRTDTEVFTIVKDARPTAAEPAQLAGLRVRLRLLADPHLTVGEPGDRRPAPLRDGEEALLHVVLASAGLAPVHRQAFQALLMRGLLTGDDVDQLLPTWRVVFPSDASTFADAALRLGHPAAGRLVSELLADGAASAELLLAWGRPAALVEARQRALGGEDVPVHLELAARQGTPPAVSALDLAAEMQARPATDPAVQRRRAEALGAVLPTALGDPASSRARNLVRVLRDDRVPARLRADIAQARADLPVHLRSALNLWTHGSAGVRPPGEPPFDPGDARAVLADWSDAVDHARRAAGLPPWPGFDPEDNRSRTAAAELGDDLVAGHVAGLRAYLGEPAASEPGLAACLDLLSAAGELRVADLAPLRARWRELFVAPAAYPTAPPALLTFVRALRDAGDPLAGTVAEAVLADSRAWSEPLRHVLTGEFAGDGADAGRLWAAATSTSVAAEHHHAAAQGFVLLDCRRTGDSPRRAAARAWAAADPRPPYVRRGFVVCAAALSEPRRPLWGSFGSRSLRWLTAALRVAEDDGLPDGFRAAALLLARESRVLSHPAEVRPVAVDLPTADHLRARVDRAATRIAGTRRVRRGPFR